ncbi:NUC185 domain-containing protein [Terfezia claveryi]|nr:NUC185 domain-containing protein [Terfezia claveryi]
MMSTTSEKLATAIQSLSLLDEVSIDSILDEIRPRKCSKPSIEEQRQILEDDFLKPSHCFSAEWLNKLQHRWKEPTDYMSLMGLAPTMSRTVIRFTREGLEGRVSGYKEVTVPAQSITAKNSTSLLRKPAAKADMVRGKAGFFPFSPGGLDIGKSNETAEELEQIEVAFAERVGADGLLQVPPGFTRGLMQPKEEKEEQVEEQDEFNFGDVKPIRKSKFVEVPTKKPDEPLSALDSIDDLLPVEFPMLALRGDLATSSKKVAAKEWAHMVDINKDLTNFHELVPNMAREWPFELDTFQKEAVYHLENGDSVFVAAHTSAGKTVVAEYGIALAAKHMTKAIYTSPIKALSNQKFRDFRNIFDDVGILTGDVQINPEASCLIMTTEILRSMLYRGADIIRDVEFVIFDEVHYVNDQERGVVWEEVIIMLPDHVNLILLSATVPNTYEFASWVGRTKKKDIYVISTPKRPVPLEHFVWANKAMYKIVNAEKKFLPMGLKDVNDALNPKKEVKPAQNQVAGRGGSNGRGNAGQRGGRGQARAAANAGSFTRSGRGGIRTTAGQDKHIWVHLVGHLKKENLLPAVIFVFSKKRCEENADALSNIDYCNQTEKSAIHMTIEKSLARLKQEDRDLPQIRRMRELLSRGLAVHHGGLLPIVKEVVEILFAKTLVKVLFATETFAMGLNLPTRTVVFSGLRKHDGQSFRDLQPGEYIQMAGRAGRRGLDPYGTVIIISPLDEAPKDATVKNMILGEPKKLKSQFRLTYNMILNLLRVEALKIEEMIKRSFGENTTQTLLPDHEREILVKQGQLKNLLRESCEVCDVDMKNCHQAAMDTKSQTISLIKSSYAAPVGRLTFAAGRLLVVQQLATTRTVGIITHVINVGSAPVINVILLDVENSRKIPSDLVPFAISKAVELPPLAAGNHKLRETGIVLENIECLTKTIIKLDVDLIRARGRSKEAVAEAERIRDLLFDYGNNWKRPEFEEVDYSKLNRNIHFQEVLQRRKDCLDRALKCVALDCPSFIRHFAMYHEEYRLQEAIDDLKRRTSDQNLALLPDYEQRVDVLKELSFIDEDSRVQLKGRVACEINSASELVLTELVLENFFANYEPEEVCALLSPFVFQEKTLITPKVTPRLEAGKQGIINIARRVNAVQSSHQVLINGETEDFVNRPRFGLMEVVYEWAKGMPFGQITDLTDVLEGTIVRVITRLDETCREVKNAARIIGDPSLFTKMQTCQELIKRDVCHCASLYL